jgi:hypothetical protein
MPTVATSALRPVAFERRSRKRHRPKPVHRFKETGYCGRAYVDRAVRFGVMAALDDTHVLSRIEAFVRPPRHSTIDAWSRSQAPQV